MAVIISKVLLILRTVNYRANRCSTFISIFTLNEEANYHNTTISFLPCIRRFICLAFCERDK